jgi:hypothetical protein
MVAMGNEKSKTPPAGKEGGEEKIRHGIVEAG